MKKRNVALLALVACAVPLVVGPLHAQPRLRDRVVQPGAISTSVAPTALAPSSGAPTTPPATPAAPAGASGKSQADTSGLAQFESAIEYEPRSPNYKVAFSLEDADLGELVRVISQLTGKRFIFGGKVKNIKASVYSPQKVTVAEAYQAFLSILEANKLTVVPHGRFLKIVDTDAVATTETPIYGTHQAAPNEDRYVTRMHRLGHISADDAAGVLGKFKSKEADITVYGPGNMVIITDTGTNIRRMMSILEEIDVGSSGDQIFIEPIHYSSAQEVEKKINELFDVKATGAAPAQAGKPGGGASVAPSVGDLHVAKVVADDRSNSLIIVATERAYLRMLELIKRIDVPQTGEGEIHVLPLQHADATELTKTLNDIITGAGGGAPGAAGGPGGRGAQQQVAAPGAQAGIFEGGVRVSADKATNSIVITSSLRDYVSLRAVIDRLDQPRRQVFIEAVIMDLQLKRSDTLGISFHGGAPFSSGIQGDNDSVLFGGNKITNTIPPVPTDPEALQGFALGVRGPGIAGSQNFLGTGISIPAFGTFIQAIARTGDTDLLSTPHILALDNEDAEINVGDNVPLQTNQGLGSLAGLAGATGAAGDGRTHFGELQVQARGGDCGFGGAHAGVALRRCGLADLELFARDRLRIDQRLRALVLHRGELLFGLRAFEVGERLVERGAIRARVDHEQQVALLDVLAFVVRHALHVTAHARAQFDRFDRGDAAGELIPLRDVLDQHVGDADFGRRRRGGRGRTRARGQRDRQQGGKRERAEDGAIEQRQPGFDGAAVHGASSLWSIGEEDFEGVIAPSNLRASSWQRAARAASSPSDVCFRPSSGQGPVQCTMGSACARSLRSINATTRRPMPSALGHCAQACFALASVRTGKSSASNCTRTPRGRASSCSTRASMRNAAAPTERWP